jgi:hypothetical protein
MQNAKVGTLKAVIRRQTNHKSSIFTGVIRVVGQTDHLQQTVKVAEASRIQQFFVTDTHRT